ncbi:hypothetical protein ScPMuIL_006398 [Solemya velum]
MTLPVDVHMEIQCLLLDIDKQGSNGARDQRHLRFTKRDWSTVLFSDESKFNFRMADGCRHVCRRRGERKTCPKIVVTSKSTNIVIRSGNYHEVSLGGHADGSQCIHKIFYSLTLAPTNCRNDLVADVIDDKITASSIYNRWGMGKPANARLLTPYKQSVQHGGWLPTEPDNQYIQVEFNDVKLITAVSTQGRATIDQQWVTHYSVQHSTDGVYWTRVQKTDGKPMIFEGNEDQDTVVTNEFASPFDAKFVRINPEQWFGSVAMRFGVSGCDLVCT